MRKLALMLTVLCAALGVGLCAAVSSGMRTPAPAAADDSGTPTFHPNAMPELSTSRDDAKLYAIVSFRGNPSTQGATALTGVAGGSASTTETIDDNALWYVTPGTAAGSYHICNYGQSAGGDRALNSLNTLGTSATDVVDFYILPNGQNELGVALSRNSDRSKDSCIDKANSSANGGHGLSGGWYCDAINWEGTTWIFVPVDRDNSAQENWNTIETVWDNTHRTYISSLISISPAPIDGEFAPGTTWYNMIINGNKMISDNGEADRISLSQNVVEGSYEAADLWCFVFDDHSNIRIYNKQAGVAGGTLSSSTDLSGDSGGDAPITVSTATEGRSDLYQLIKHGIDGKYALRLSGTSYGYVNDRTNVLAYWTSSNAIDKTNGPGSAIEFLEAEIPVEPTTIENGKYADNTKWYWITVDDKYLNATPKEAEYYNGFALNNDKESPVSPKEAWCFVESDGRYKIFNMSKPASKALDNRNSNNTPINSLISADSESALWSITPFVGHNGYYLVKGAGGYLQNFGTSYDLGVWSAAENHSRVKFIEIPADQIPDVYDMYAVNVEEGEATTSGRYTESIMFGENQTIGDLQTAVSKTIFFDKTEDVTLTAAAGSETDLKFMFHGHNMHQTVFIDFDGKGFDGRAYKNGGELMLAIKHTGDKDVCDRDADKLVIPADIAPGKYRIRFKIDREDALDPVILTKGSDGSVSQEEGATLSSDPAGNYNALVGDGGVIVDAMITITDPELEANEARYRFLNRTEGASDAKSWTSYVTMDRPYQVGMTAEGNGGFAQYDEGDRSRLAIDDCTVTLGTPEKDAYIKRFKIELSAASGTSTITVNGKTRELTATPRTIVIDGGTADTPLSFTVSGGPVKVESFEFTLALPFEYDAWISYRTMYKDYLDKLTAFGAVADYASQGCSSMEEAIEAGKTAIDEAADEADIKKAARPYFAMLDGALLELRNTHPDAQGYYLSASEDNNRLVVTAESGLATAFILTCDPADFTRYNLKHVLTNSMVQSYPDKGDAAWQLSGSNAASFVLDTDPSTGHAGLSTRTFYAGTATDHSYIHWSRPQNMNVTTVTGWNFAETNSQWEVAPAAIDDEALGAVDYVRYLNNEMKRQPWAALALNKALDKVTDAISRRDFTAAENAYSEGVIEAESVIAARAIGEKVNISRIDGGQWLSADGNRSLFTVMEPDGTEATSGSVWTVEGTGNGKLRLVNDRGLYLVTLPTADNAIRATTAPSAGKEYVISSYRGRPDGTTDPFDSPAVLTASGSGVTTAGYGAISDDSKWTVTENADGSLTVLNKGTGKKLNGNWGLDDNGAPLWGLDENGAPLWVLPTGVNDSGIAISKTNPISGSSCLDKNNAQHKDPYGVGSYRPYSTDWRGTTWMFVEVSDNDDDTWSTVDALRTNGVIMEAEATPDAAEAAEMTISLADGEVILTDASGNGTSVAIRPNQGALVKPMTSLANSETESPRLYLIRNVHRMEQNWTSYLTADGTGNLWTAASPVTGSFWVVEPTDGDKLKITNAYHYEHHIAGSHNQTTDDAADGEYYIIENHFTDAASHNVGLYISEMPTTEDPGAYCLDRVGNADYHTLSAGWSPRDGDFKGTAWIFIPVTEKMELDLMKSLVPEVENAISMIEYFKSANPWCHDVLDDAMSDLYPAMRNDIDPGRTLQYLRERDANTVGTLAEKFSEALADELPDYEFEMASYSHLYAYNHTVNVRSARIGVTEDQGKVGIVSRAKDHRDAFRFVPAGDGWFYIMNGEGKYLNSRGTRTMVSEEAKAGKFTVELLFNPADMREGNYFTCIRQSNGNYLKLALPTTDGEQMYLGTYNENDTAPSAGFEFSKWTPDATGIDTVEPDDAFGEGFEGMYNLQGVRVSPDSAAPGIYIVRNGGKVMKVLIR